MKPCKGGASCSPARRVVVFLVTLTDHKTARSYPCRSLEAAATLARRFVASVTKAAR